MNKLCRILLGTYFAIGAASAQAAAPGIYWTDRGAGRIERANLDGTGRTTLLTVASPNNNHLTGIDVDTVNDQMYFNLFAIGGNGDTLIRRANLDGSGATTFANVTPLGFGGLALERNQSSGQLFWTTDNFTVSGVHRINADATGATTLLAGLTNPMGLALDVGAGKMYYGSSTSISRASLNGSAPEILVTGSQPREIVLDTGAGHMYWTTIINDGLGGRIRRANVDGTGVVDILTGLSQPTAIALDPISDKLYWSELGTSTIWWSNMDGTGAQLVASGAGMQLPLYISVIPAVPEPATLGVMAIVAVFTISRRRR